MLLSQQSGSIEDLLDGRCDGATRRALVSSLERVCNTLAAAATSDLRVHALDCPNVAQHEQALVMAVRALQSGNEFGYTAAMSAIVHPSAVRVLRRDMQQIALALIRTIENSGGEPSITADTLRAANPGAALLH